MINQKDSIDIIVVLGVFALTSVKSLPHMSALLRSVNTFKFSTLPNSYYENLQSGGDRSAIYEVHYNEKLDKALESERKWCDKPGNIIERPYCKCITKNGTRCKNKSYIFINVFQIIYN